MPVIPIRPRKNKSILEFLPRELLVYIFDFLPIFRKRLGHKQNDASFSSVWNVMLVCKAFRRAVLMAPSFLMESWDQLFPASKAAPWETIYFLTQTVYLWKRALQKRKSWTCCLWRGEGRNQPLLLMEQEILDLEHVTLADLADTDDAWVEDMLERRKHSLKSLTVHLHHAFTGSKLSNLYRSSNVELLQGHHLRQIGIAAHPLCEPEFWDNAAFDGGIALDVDHDETDWIISTHPWNRDGVCIYRLRPISSRLIAHSSPACICPSRSQHDARRMVQFALERRDGSSETIGAACERDRLLFGHLACLTILERLAIHPATYYEPDADNSLAPLVFLNKFTVMQLDDLKSLVIDQAYEKKASQGLTQHARNSTVEALGSCSSLTSFTVGRVNLEVLETLCYLPAGQLKVLHLGILDEPLDPCLFSRSAFSQLHTFSYHNTDFPDDSDLKFDPLHYTLATYWPKLVELNYVAQIHSAQSFYKFHKMLQGLEDLQFSNIDVSVDPDVLTSDILSDFESAVGSAYLVKLQNQHSQPRATFVIDSSP